MAASEETILEISDFSTVTRYEKYVRAVELCLRQYMKAERTGSTVARTVAVTVDAEHLFNLHITGGGCGDAAPSDVLLSDLADASRDFDSSQSTLELHFGARHLAFLEPLPHCDPALCAQSFAILTLALSNAKFCHPCFTNETVLEKTTLWDQVRVGAASSRSTPTVSGYGELGDVLVRCRTESRSPVPRQFRSIEGVVGTLSSTLQFCDGLEGSGVSASCRKAFHKPAFSQKDWAYLDDFANPSELKWGTACDPVACLTSAILWESVRVDNTFSQNFNESSPTEATFALRVALNDETPCKLSSTLRSLVDSAVDVPKPVAQEGDEVTAIFQKCLRDVESDEGAQTFFHRLAYYVCTVNGSLENMCFVYGRLCEFFEQKWEKNSKFPEIPQNLLDGAVSDLDKRLQMLLFCIIMSREKKQGFIQNLTKKKKSENFIAGCIAPEGDDDDTTLVYPITQGMVLSSGANLLQTFSDDINSDAQTFKHSNPTATAEQFAAWRGTEMEEGVWESVQPLPVWEQLTPIQMSTQARNCLIYLKAVRPEQIQVAFRQHYFAHGFTLLDCTNYVKQIPVAKALLCTLKETLGKAKKSEVDAFFLSLCDAVQEVEILASLAESVIERLMYPETITEEEISTVLAVVNRLLSAPGTASKEISLTLEEWNVVQKSLAMSEDGRKREADNEEYIIRSAGRNLSGGMLGVFCTSSKKEKEKKKQEKIVISYRCVDLD